jgi:mannose/cellobiose epimerase-like protein (N-acyl-D-glucosamine 2-epimerase family)
MAVVIRTREAVRSWLFDQALPFWAAHGFDREHGGYVEQLTLDGRDAGVDFKRTRVAGRQVYVFSHAATMGWRSGATLAETGILYLTERAWLGPDKGFARRTTRDGKVLDPTPALYDLAFVLFAFAWHHRAMKDALSLGWMHRTMDFIEQHMRHPGGLGFWHQLPPDGFRLQNPHMHLTEACLAAFEATGEQRFADHAKALVKLFQTKFFDTASGTLAEYFNDDWSRAAGEDGCVTEPGHQLEWAWILNSARKLLGVDTAAEIRATIAFAERHGVDQETSVTYNSVRDDGTAIDRGSRTWPNTERLKAAVALYELDGVDPAPVIDPTVELLFQRYLSHDPPGTWIDAFNEHGQPASMTIPASTFYHVFLAFAEVLRISDSSPANGAT